MGIQFRDCTIINFKLILYIHISKFSFHWNTKLSSEESDCFICTLHKYLINVKMCVLSPKKVWTFRLLICSLFLILLSSLFHKLIKMCKTKNIIYQKKIVSILSHTLLKVYRREIKFYSTTILKHGFHFIIKQYAYAFGIQYWIF